MEGSSEGLFELYAKSSSITRESAYTYRFGVGSLSDYLAKSEIDLLDADRVDIEKWVSSIRRGLSPSTVANYVSAVKGFYSWCEDYFGKPNPASEVEPPKARRTAKKLPALDPSKLGIVMSSARMRAQQCMAGMRDLAILRLMILCCVRSGEIVAANAGDFRAEGGTCVLAVRKTDGSDFSAVLPLDEETASSIRAHLAHRGPVSPEEPLFAAVASPNTGGRLNYKSVNRILREALVPVGETPWSVSMVKTALAAAVSEGGKSADDGYVRRIEAVEEIVSRLYGKPIGGVDGLGTALSMEGASSSAVTVRSARRMLEDFRGDDEVVFAIDGNGRLSVAPYIRALPDSLQSHSRIQAGLQFSSQ